MTNFCPRCNHGNLYLLCYYHSFYVAFVLMTWSTFSMVNSDKKSSNPDNENLSYFCKNYKNAIKLAYFPKKYFIVSFGVKKNEDYISDLN